MVAVLFVGEDPGGVDVLVPVKKRLDALGVPSRVLSSGPGNAVWQRHSIAFDDVTGDMADPIDPAEVRALIESVRPKVLITATSFPRRVEKFFRREARALGIPSIMVLDADRGDLYRTELDEMACRPDFAVSIGNRMTARLHAALYRHEQVITAGHLALAEIAAAGRSFPDSDIAAWKRDFMKCHDGRELIVVFSDNVRQVFGEAGAIAEIGYHEGIAVPALLRAIAGTAFRKNRSYEVVVKLHPKEAPGAFDEIFRKVNSTSLHVREVSSCDNLRLIRSADHIFGLYSIIMVWCALLGRLTLSYQPNARKDSFLVTAEEGAVPCCWRANELDGMVEAFLTDPAWRTQWQARLSTWQPIAVDGVASVTQHVLALVGTGIRA